MSSVTQPWVNKLKWAEQSILISSLRGPDYDTGIDFKAVTKLLRTNIVNVYGKNSPYNSKEYDMGLVLWLLAINIDEVYSGRLCPHWLDHTVAAVNVLGRKHPDDVIRKFWNEVYETHISKFPHPFKEI